MGLFFAFFQYYHKDLRKWRSAIMIIIGPTMLVRIIALAAISQESMSAAPSDHSRGPIAVVAEPRVDFGAGVAGGTLFRLGRALPNGRGS